MVNGYDRTHITLFVTTVFLCALLVVGYVRMERLTQRTTALADEFARTKGEFASTSAGLLGHIDALNTLLATTTKERDNLAENVILEQTLLGAMQSELSSAHSTLGTLQKLTTTDKELLMQYSRVYFLNEHYVPKSLSPIPLEFVYRTKKDERIATEVLPFLNDLLSGARAQGINLYVLSAYRSFGEQSTLKSRYTVEYGAGTANKFSADQGYSEHQLGTAVDFTTKKLGEGFTAFADDPAYVWLREYGYQYGFILSYPPKNAYYVFEPWHWRFVGKALATRLHDEHHYFYDLTQRDINASLVNIFDQ
jgi:LAS superfamily LD-carboxypeptidase LdcB